jgi:hypothetical protein
VELSGAYSLGKFEANLQRCSRLGIASAIQESEESKGEESEGEESEGEESEGVLMGFRVWVMAASVYW